MSGRVLIDESPDFKPIEQRRQMCVVIKRRTYDTETASPLWGKETIHSAICFTGVKLYQNVYDQVFVHHYHQWERFNSITPLSKARAIDFMEQNCPHLIFELYGRLPEAGQPIRPRKAKAKTP